MEILYQDNHLFVVNKPAGLVTQPTQDSTDSLEEQAKAWIKREKNKSGEVFLHCVHRLDKPVSGIVVFARTSKALERMNKLMREKRYQKMYRALVEPAPLQDSGELEDYLLRSDFVTQVVDSSVVGAKLARLKYQVVEREGSQALLNIELETGRYHQIRAQLAHIGCPIVGDIKYGSCINGGESIELQHYQFKGPHPVGLEIICISIPK